MKTQTMYPILVPIKDKKATKLFLSRAGVLELDRGIYPREVTVFSLEGYTPQQLYIVSQNKIEVYDWCIYKNKIGGLIQLCRAIDTSFGRVYQNPESDYGSPDGGITPLDHEIFKVEATLNYDLLLQDCDCDFFCLKNRMGYCDHRIRTKYKMIPDSFVEEFIKAYNSGHIISEVKGEIDDNDKLTIHSTVTA